LRDRIESAFQYRYPIWSDRKTLDLRRQCVEVFGVDPHTAKVSELRELGPKLNLDFSGFKNKEEFISEFFCRVGVRKPQNKSTV
jgi:hypothetical protein